jgi:hypothetical protein
MLLPVSYGRQKNTFAFLYKRSSIRKIKIKIKIKIFRHFHAVTEAAHINDCFVSMTDTEIAGFRKIVIVFHDYISSTVLNRGQMGWTVRPSE